MNVLSLLKARFRPALESIVPDPSKLGELLDMVRPVQDAKFGDYQANFAMSLGKQLGRQPRELAAEVIAAIDLADICTPPEVAGPGFINLRLRDDWLAEQLNLAVRDERLGIAPAREPRTIVIDYSSPNVAKPMHVGHIRSTVIGDALCRTLRFLGHRVISDNHLGDWGTQFGMIIKGWKINRDEEHYASSPVAELSRLYRLVNTLTIYHDSKSEVERILAKIVELQSELDANKAEPTPSDPKAGKAKLQLEKRAEEVIAQRKEELASRLKHVNAVDNDLLAKALADQNPDIGEQVLAETAKLHGGDAENLRLWHEFLPHCRDEIARVYRRLNVEFDYEYGESFYHDRLAGVVHELRAKGLAQDSQGAVCVFIDGFDAPMIVQKKDGAFLYSTTDLATIQYRMQTWRPDAILYVVDHRQSDHFDKLFAVARRWGYSEIELQHIKFGTVMGSDGKPFKTREGVAAGLESLLDEAVARAAVVVAENDPGNLLSADERLQVAEVVGVGGLKFADLLHNRTSDYEFSYDKMLLKSGYSATYAQYTFARCCSIFRKAELDRTQLRTSGNGIMLSHPAERALGIQLLRLAEALEETAADYMPHHLTAYLFDVARAYSAFFEHCPVLQAENQALRNSRLLLCDLTGRTIKLGLDLLGIGVVEKM